FIPLAENLGLMEQLGKQVSELAMSQFARCEKQLSNHMFVSINISNRQLISSDFVSNLIKDIERYDVPPEKFKLEITESIALLGIDRAREYLERLSNFGFKLSLDDFGTGYSSLAYLHELPIDEIKIDMSFVRRIHTPSGRIMLKTITDMGRALKMAVVAEGVESKEAADILRDLGVGLLQGYYFRKPGPKEDCLEYVQACQAGHVQP
ncbi:MAG: EAL domain-containing protein, partial [Sulfuricellaceae bacterium]|nr:EAL domain-containing protein [Sulfuricellaceae bacterium]